MSGGIQFCGECNNLLYPKEDKEHKQLIFLCRSCDFLQYADPYSATQNTADRMNYNFRSKEDVNSYIAQGLGHDPTLPRRSDWHCPKCNRFGAVYFQLPERVADDAMTLVYVCSSCTYYEVRGKEAPNQDRNDDASLIDPLTFYGGDSADLEHLRVGDVVKQMASTSDDKKQPGKRISAFATEDGADGDDDDDDDDDFLQQGSSTEQKLIASPNQVVKGDEGEDDDGLAFPEEDDDDGLAFDDD